MGIISFFRGLFSKDIMFKGENQNHLVFVYKAKKGRIWFEKNIIVPENMEFYFAKNGAVLDGFLTGEHEITPMYLSKTVRALKLNKVKKKVKDLKYFSADAYFVSLLQTEVKDWKLFTKIEFYDEKFGYFKAMIEGKYIAKVTNARQFLKKLLIVYDYLKQGEAEDILEGFISETIFNVLLKKKVDLSFLQNNEKLTDFLFEKLTNAFARSGVEILGFSVEKVRFSKRFENKIKQHENQKAINKKIKFLEEGLLQEDYLLEQSNENTEQSQEEIKQTHEEIEKTKDEIVQTEESVNETGILKTEIFEGDDVIDKKALAMEKLKIEPSKPIIKQKVNLNILESFEEDKQEDNEVLNNFEPQKIALTEISADIIDKNSQGDYNNSNNKKPLQPQNKTEIKVKCQVCGEDNIKADNFCVLCGEKLK